MEMNSDFTARKFSTKEDVKEQEREKTKQRRRRQQLQRRRQRRRREMEMVEEKMEGKGEAVSEETEETARVWVEGVEDDGSGEEEGGTIGRNQRKRRVSPYAITTSGVGGIQSGRDRKSVAFFQTHRSTPSSPSVFQSPAPETPSSSSPPLSPPPPSPPTLVLNAANLLLPPPSTPVSELRCFRHWDRHGTSALRSRSYSQLQLPRYATLSACSWRSPCSTLSSFDLSSFGGE